MGHEAGTVPSGSPEPGRQDRSNLLGGTGEGQRRSCGGGPQVPPGDDLSDFGTDSAARFGRTLDRHTKRLSRRLPRGAQHWGLARKLLNIYLRDCLYCTYLNTEFHLAPAEALFEVPLDSITARGLKQATGRGALPVWPGVRHLRPDVNAELQRFAADLARGDHIARVHLDAVYWSMGLDE